MWLVLDMDRLYPVILPVKQYLKNLCVIVIQNGNDLTKIEISFEYGRKQYTCRLRRQHNAN